MNTSIFSRGSSSFCVLTRFAVIVGHTPSQSAYITSRPVMGAANVCCAADARPYAVVSSCRLSKSDIDSTPNLQFAINNQQSTISWLVLRVSLRRDVEPQHHRVILVNDIVTMKHVPAHPVARAQSDGDVGVLVEP